MRLKDLTGQKFGRLTVIERTENAADGHAQWRCRCDCGNITVVASNNLQRGIIKSCGCLHKEMFDRTTHGMADTPIFYCWSGIKARCYNPKHKSFKDYGGRGVTMFSAWVNDFKAFYNYVSQLSHFGEKGYTLDRIDNSGNYEPNNVRWATAKIQTRNRRNNRFVEYNGELMTMAEASEKSGLPKYILRNRLKSGDTGERLFRPVKK